MIVSEVDQWGEGQMTHATKPLFPLIATKAALAVLLVVFLGQGLRAEDCSVEAREIMNALEAMRDAEPGAEVLIGQVKLATEYCSEGNARLFDAFIAPARAFLDESEAHSRADPDGD